MNKTFIILLLMVLVQSMLPGTPLQDSLVQALKTLYTKKSEPLVVSFGTFTHGDKNIGTGFSRYLENQITLSIQKIPYLKLFARDNLEEILETQEMNLSGMFSNEDIPEIGNLLSVGGILSGRFYDSDEDIEVFLDLISIETGTYYGSTSLILSKGDVPESIVFLPDNYTNALDVLKNLEDIDNSTNTGELEINVWCKRGDGGTYINKEELVLHFYSNKDCYIKIYHIDVNGEMSLIFPNIYHEHNFIQKETVYTIPDDTYEFTFKLGPPYGTEFIKVVASVEQFADIETAFKSLGDSSAELIKRGLTVEQRKKSFAEAIFSYTILED